MIEIDVDFVRPSDGDTLGITVNTLRDMAIAEQEMSRYGYRVVDAKVVR